LINGNLRGKTITVSQAVASGIFTRDEVFLYKYSNEYPLNFNTGDQYFNYVTVLINADANTIIRDRSTNNLGATIAGNVRPAAYSPFENNRNGSGYFDSSDYLEITKSASLALEGGGAWTIELFAYTITHGIFLASYTGPSNSGGSFSFGTGTNQMYFNWIANGTDQWQSDTGAVGVTNTAIVTNKWQHLAVSYNGAGSMRFFCDGALLGTVSRTVNVDTMVYNPRIGRSMHPSYPTQYAGHISNLRVTKGNALYTSSFTVPSGPLEAQANTVLLALSTNSLTKDSSSVNTSITNSGTTLSSFGPFVETDITSGSVYFDGSGDYIDIASNTALALGTADFTIEFWANIITHKNYIELLDGRGGTANSTRPVLYSDSAGLIYYYVNNANRITSSAVSAGGWHHIAVSRSSGSTKMFINGVQAGSTYTDSNNYDHAVWRIGSAHNGTGADTTNYSMNGYISNFRYVKGTALYTTEFTPPTSELTAVSGTQLLLLQGRTGFNNHGFIDESSVNSLITREGNATLSSFSPFSRGSWSNHFDGAGDYLLIGSTYTPIAFLTSSGGVGTIEAWVYPTAFRSDAGGAQVGYTHPCILGLGSTYLNIGINNGYPKLYYWTGAPNSVVSNTAISLNRWSHIAYVWSGSGSNNLKMYVNGSLANTSTFTNINWASAGGGNNLYVGVEGANVAYSSFPGYISDLRIVNGTAYYTSNFSPPTQPLTAISGTTLLTCQNNIFKDNSSTNAAITSYNSAKVTSLSPYPISNALSTSIHGGSLYLDGSDDLYLPDSIYLALPGDFTIEFWVFPQTTALVEWISKGSGIQIYQSSGSWYIAVSSNNSSTYFFNAIFGSVKPYQWQHVAVTRSGNTYTGFVNGVATSIGTSASAPSTGTNVLYVGRVTGATPYYAVGHLTGLRIVKGTALYSGTFTTPTTFPTGVENTVALLNFNNAAAIDYSQQGFLEFQNDAKINHNIKKLGTGSFAFDGTSDYITSSTSELYGYGTGDFTIEFWLYLNNTNLQSVLSHLTSVSAILPHLYIASGGSIRYYTNNSDRITGSTLVAGVWYHIALSRVSGTTRLFIDGTQTGANYTDANDYGTTAPLTIGSYINAGAIVTSEHLNGYIDDLRITRGHGRYASNFTPSTSPFNAATALL